MLRALGAALALAWTPGPAAAQEAMQPQRVVGLGGAATEIAFALGAGGQMIARDSSSGFPPEAVALPDVGYMRQLSPEGVLAVGPDLILAEEGAGPPQAVQVLKGADIRYAELPEPHDGAGVVARIRTAGEVLGRSAEAEALAAEVETDLGRAAEAVAADPGPPPRVLLVLSLQGGRVLAGGANTSADTMIGLAGGVNVAAGFDGWKAMTDEAIIASAPDVVVVMQRGGSGADAEAETAAVAAARRAALDLPAIAATPAGRNGAFVMMDGLYLLGLGPRTGKAALELFGAIRGRG